MPPAAELAPATEAAREGTGAPASAVAPAAEAPAPALEAAPPAGEGAPGPAAGPLAGPTLNLPAATDGNCIPFDQLLRLNPALPPNGQACFVGGSLRLPASAGLCCMHMHWRCAACAIRPHPFTPCPSLPAPQTFATQLMKLPGNITLLLPYPPAFTSSVLGQLPDSPTAPIDPGLQRKVDAILNFTTGP